MPRCGNCSSFQRPVDHATVAQVQLCYRRRYVAEGRVPVGQTVPASHDDDVMVAEQDRQLEQHIARNYGDSGQSMHTEFGPDTDANWMTTLTNIARDWTLQEGDAERSKTEIQKSDIIRSTMFLGLQSATGDAHGKRSNRFAIVDPDDDTLKFLLVETIVDDESKWNGWTFVKVQASDDFYKLGNLRPGDRQSYKGKRHSVVRELMRMSYDELVEAMKRYAHDKGVCGVCGKTLTDENSRAAGIGPICARKVGV